MDWEKEWAEAQERSPLKITADNEAKWNRYWDACAPQYLREVRREEQHYRSILRFMRSHGWLKVQDRVLDLGCGPGTYSLLMAEQAAYVTALDPSEGMIATLMAEAQRRGLFNLDAITQRFEDAAICQDFDLVFCGLSPAVRDAATLRRMENCSRGRCALVTFGGGSEMSTRNELWELLVGEFRPSNPYDAVFPLNVLRQWGREVEMEKFAEDVVVSADPEVVISNYEMYFSIFTEMDRAKKQSLRRYVLERCQDGIFIREFRRTLALLCWRSA